jgi:hypothetical protein
MTDKPIIDRATIEKIMSDAKCQRVRHLGNAWRESPKGIRWSGLGLALALCLTAFGAEFVSGAHAGNGHGGYFHNLIAKR